MCIKNVFLSRSDIHEFSIKDVHTSCSTPCTTKQPEIFSESFNSPSGSIPYSQENYPDVIWDYTSPKLPKGSKRREIKITVEEFLKNLTQHQVPECKTQSAHYIKLLENWMTKKTQNTTVQKVQRNVKRENKKRSRRVIEEIKQFMESIKMQSKGDSAEANLRENYENNELNVEYITTPPKTVMIDKKSFLKEAKEYDSVEELWGDLDNSFIVKATQEMEVSSPPQMISQNLEVVSTIPETICSSANISKGLFPVTEQNETADKNPCNSRLVLDANDLTDHQAEIIFSQLVNCDWESGSDDDWENGFLGEDDDWSHIPDEVLLGTHTVTSNNPSNNSTVLSNSNEVICCDTEQNIKDFSATVTNKVKDCDNVNEPKNITCENFCEPTCEPDSAALFNSFDDANFSIDENFGDENFCDESILCKPEVLSWIDEVESKLSQNLKCTPEEIEKKKDEALRRLKNKQSEKKPP